MRSCHGEFSHNNPLRRKDSIRRVKRGYEKSERGKRVRLFNYEAKWNFLLNVRAQLKCEDCDIDNPIILTFHHRNPKDKKFHLSSVSACRSWKSIIKEIEKCDVLCFNCHILRQDKMSKQKKSNQKYTTFLIKQEKQMKLDF